ncbi:NgoMIV family type II restriction endonuclease [Kitasatospora sp. NPDC058162]|uniref:NgoMIV family type II restriction endonuclease n=1 Tax=Kitasatospora sp. NPDC058162 TaxID=3346362 RepID=UPI0036D7D983
MPASFVTDLCGYRNGKPNTSDSSKADSVELGRIFFERLGVPEEKHAEKNDHTWSLAMVADLQGKLKEVAQHLTVERERHAHEFEQYAHLGAIQRLADDDSLPLDNAVRNLQNHLPTAEEGGEETSVLVEALLKALDESRARRRPLLDALGDESLPKLDISVHRALDGAAIDRPHLVAGFSLKWSLRTDRLQDPRTHGAKMATLRRGRMPHFAAVTMEPRPYFLARLGQGTGDLDCVYHLHLPALTAAVDEYYSATKSRLKTRDTFHRMVEQRRLRDYDDLVAYLGTL